MESYAINLSFDSKFDSYVRGLCKESFNMGSASFIKDIEGKEPHIAIGVYRDVESEGFIKAFHRFLEEELYGFELYVDAVAIFKATNLIFLQSNINEELRNLIEKAQDIFINYEENLNPFYKKERIFPHITVAHDDDNEVVKKIFNFVFDNFEPQKAKVKSIDLVEIIYENNKIIGSKIVAKKELM